MNDLILQIGVGKFEPLLNFSETFTRNYATVLGVEYLACDWAVRGVWSFHEKFLQPMSFMDGSGKLMAVLDADVIVTGTDDFRAEMQDADFAAVRNQLGELNLGVFFIRDTDAMIGFLNRCAEMMDAESSRLGSPNVDQLILNRELNYTRLRTKALNRRWNDYRFAKGSVDGATQIRGFHDLSTTPEHKLALMHSFVEKRDAAA